MCDSDDGSADESALHSADGRYLTVTLYTVTPDEEENCSVHQSVNREVIQKRSPCLSASQKTTCRDSGSQAEM